MVLLDAAAAAGVERFVFVSTDKAVRPSSVMGASKRIAEMLVADAARRTGRPYVSVRFGNVLGSTGSVVPIFQEQLENGEPLTITHPDMTRFFMTIPEAAWLILDAAALGRDGDLFVLDMGEPVRIMDLARDLVRLAGPRPRQPADRDRGPPPGREAPRGALLRRGAGRADGEREGPPGDRAAAAARTSATTSRRMLALANGARRRVAPLRALRVHPARPEEAAEVAERDGLRRRPAQAAARGAARLGGRRRRRRGERGGALTGLGAAPGALAGATTRGGRASSLISRRIRRPSRGSCPGVAVSIVAALVLGGRVARALGTRRAVGCAAGRELRDRSCRRRSHHSAARSTSKRRWPGPAATCRGSGSRRSRSCAAQRHEPQRPAVHPARLRDRASPAVATDAGADRCRDRAPVRNRG